jgi:hypothetical protein
MYARPYVCASQVLLGTHPLGCSGGEYFEWDDHGELGATSVLSARTHALLSVVSKYRTVCKLTCIKIYIYIQLTVNCCCGGGGVDLYGSSTPSIA